MNNIKGFSLVELMVAVGIVGVMSSVAVPKYQKYKVNATRAEAQSSLSSMYTLQQLYYTENDRYGNVDGKAPGSGVINEVNFPINNAQKYTYMALTGTSSAISAADFTSPPSAIAGDGSVFFKSVAESKQVLGSCAAVGKKDKWCINYDKILINDKSASAITANPPPAAPCVAGDVEDGGC